MVVGAALGLLLFVSIAPAPACDPGVAATDVAPALVRAIPAVDIDPFCEDKRLPDRFDEKKQMTCVAFDQECLDACGPAWGACQNACNTGYPPGPERTACIAACDQSYYECYYPACCI